MPPRRASSPAKRRGLFRLLLDLDALAFALGEFRLGAGFRGGDVLLVGGADDDEAAVGAGDGAADDEEVILEVDLDDVEIANGGLGVAVLPGGEMAELGSAGAAVGRVRAGAAALTMVLLGAVSGGHAGEVVPFHGT